MTVTVTTIDEQTFSDGRSLTQWLVRNGAPALEEGQRYRLLVNDQRRTAPQVTAQILEGPFVLSEYTEVTRVNIGMASLAAAKYAYEGLAR